MHCTNCGFEIKSNYKFCANCGKSVPVSGCPGCGSALMPGANFCVNCGTSLGSGSGGAQLHTPPPPAPPAAALPGKKTDLQDLSDGESVIMDTGFFPITFSKSFMNTINGKLYLTNMRLVFKGVALQGVDANSFSLNTNQANKAKTYFYVPLRNITAVIKGHTSVNIYAGEEYKFGALRKPGEWVDAIDSLRSAV